MISRIVLSLLCLSLAACAKQPVSVSRPVETTPDEQKQMTVGVILPLSGDYELYGQSTLHGIECAAGLKVPCSASANVRLVVKDSAGDPAQAVAAVRSLVQDDQVAAIIGPLMSKTVEAAAKEANALGVPLLSLSRRDGVAELGEYSYRVAMNGRSQVRAIVKHAIQNNQQRRLAVLYPSSRFGRTFRDLFRDAVSEFGGEIIHERGYPKDLTKVLEAHLAIQEAEETGQSRSASRRFDFTEQGLVIHDYADRELPKLRAISDVDAVFCPDSYRAIVAMMTTYGRELFGEAQLLGINRWNNRGLLEGGDNLNGAQFVGGFFSESANVETQRFVDIFKQAYGVMPTYLEAQAYDALQLLVRATPAGQVTAASVQKGLQRLRRFHGVTGGMRFDQHGDADKDLFVLMVAGGHIAEVGTKRRAPHVSKDQYLPVAPVVEAKPQVTERSGVVNETPQAKPHPKYDVGGEAPASSAVFESKYGDVPVDLAL